MHLHQTKKTINTLAVTSLIKVSVDYLFIYIFIYFIIYLFLYLCIYLFIYLFIYVFIYLFVYFTHSLFNNNVLYLQLKLVSNMSYIHYI